jgi:hypothetical protein
MGLEIIYAVIYGLAIALSSWAIVDVKSFLRSTPGIADARSLERFKAIARINMYLALFQIVLLTAGLITGIVLIVRYGSLGMVAVLLTNGMVFAMGKHLGSLEKAARALPSASEELGQQHRRISETWVSKALPDF